MSLRRPVNAKFATVWQFRNDVDVYTLQPKKSVLENNPEIDHILEIAFLQDAQQQACVREGARAWQGFAAMHMGELLQNIANDVTNLNVTSRRVNQKKKGPFTSVRNRLNKSTDRDLRTITLEQFARSGAAKTLVDDGTWARIEGSIVQTWDAMKEEFETDNLLHVHPDTQKLMSNTVEEIDDLMLRIGLM